MSVDDGYTKALLHMNGDDAGTTFTDESGKTWTANGDAQLDTAVKKFGSAAGLFDGNGDYVHCDAHEDFDMGSGDWTVDCWVNPTDNANNYPTILSCVTGWETNSCGLRWDNTGQSQKFGFFWNPSDPLFGSTNTFAAGSWYHLALVRNGTSIKMYVNGVEEASTTVDSGRTINWSFGGIRIGFSTWDGAHGYFSGSIDEPRISKGIARWTADFSDSLPSAEYAPAAGSAPLFMHHYNMMRG